MNLSLNELLDFTLDAEDGEIGSVQDVLFEEDGWYVRYVVVDTGPWLFGRKVLIAPLALREPDAAGKKLPVRLTKQQVKDSPDIEADPPISRDAEIAVLDFFRWPYYWGGGPTDTASMSGIELTEIERDETVAGPEPRMDEASQRDRDLHSAYHILNYEVRFDAEACGQVADLIFDATAWTVAHIVVSLKGHHPEDKDVLLPTSLIDAVNHADGYVTIRATPQDLADAPTYDESVRRDKLFHDKVTEHYGQRI